MNQPNRSTPVRTRRQYLRWVGSGGLAGLAGCSGINAGQSPAAEATPKTTEPPTATPSPTKSPTSTARPAEESCTSIDPEVPSSDDEWWPAFRHSSYNDGFNEATTGPTKDVGNAWRFETGGRVRSSPAVWDGTVYVGSEDGIIYAIDMVTGQQQWVFETGGPVVSSPSVFKDRVYVGSNDHTIYALDANQGVEHWSYQTGGPVRSSPAVEQQPLRDTGVVAIGSDDGHVYVLNAKSGEVEFDGTTGGEVVATPVLTYTDHGLWLEVGSTDGVVYGRDIGRETWIPWAEAGAAIRSSIATFHNSASVYEPLFFGADDGVMYQQLGEKKGAWEFESEGKIRSSAAVSEDPDLLYFGSHDHRVYAVDWESGEERWTYETNGEIDSSPAVVEGGVYIGSGDHRVYALDKRSGDKLWDFRTGAGVLSSPAVVNGTVFVGSDDGFVYALTTCQ